LPIKFLHHASVRSADFAPSHFIARCGLALRTMAIPAGVVRDSLMRAVIALLQGSARAAVRHAHMSRNARSWWAALNSRIDYVRHSDRSFWHWFLLYKGNGGGLAGRDFAEKLCPVNKCQTIWVWVGRVARPGMSQLVNKLNQRVRQPFMFHYAFFVA